MNKLKCILAVLTASFALTSAAQALTWEDRDPNSGDGPLKFLTENSTTYTSDFNILLDGYDPLTMVVTSAKVWFAFADDSNSDSEEKVKILLDSSVLVGSLEVNGLHPYSNYAWYEFDVTGAALASLQDGILDYSVILKNTTGTNDTYLKIALLEATGSSRSVPDTGASIALLGLTLGGMVCVRRRFAPRR